MYELTRKISGPRLPHIRALAPLLVPLVASAIGAIAVVALLMPGGHGRTQRSAPVPVASSPQRTCGRDTSPAGVGPVTPAIPARQGTLGGLLDAALRAARTRLQAPGATAAVVVCGHVVWADATGVVDLRSQHPADNQSLFILNSAAKTVVATMVMREIEDGHLSLSTKLSQFYPWLPNARQISVRMLLDMTSGLPDYLYNRRIDWMIDNRPRHHWTVDQVLTGLGTGLGAPKFPPGRDYQYSDTNYIVLGGILEQITHTSIERDFQQLIARSLGITSATFVPSPAAEAQIAHPYLRYRNGTLRSQWISGFGVSSAVWGPVFTDGGLASSSLDLAWFGNALLGGRLVTPAAVKQMSHIGRGDYGFGMRARSFDGHYWLGHRGYFGGFEVEDWTDPSRQVTIAVATNLQMVGSQPPTSTRIWTSLARTYDAQKLRAGQTPSG